MNHLHDDLGSPVALPPQGASRIVSLVPSLTEFLAELVPERLVGATRWCTHPADLTVARVRGTKNPDLRAIAALAPDLVVANREENRELDVRRLREAGLNVWVTEINDLRQAKVSLMRLCRDVVHAPAPAWLNELPDQVTPPPPGAPLVAVPIWKDPWMWVAGGTFAHAVLEYAGYRNVLADLTRYPSLAPEDVVRRGPELLLLPDEPFDFDATALAGTTLAKLPSDLISGRLLTWYGPSLQDVALHHLPR